MCKRIVCLSLIISFAVVVLSASRADAVDMDFITYNGYYALETALENVQIIFNAQNYKKLLAVMAVGGMFFGLAIAGFRGLKTGQFNILQTLLPIFAGIVLVLVIVFPSRRNGLWLEDRVLNINRHFDNLPLSLVLTAGALNGVSIYLCEIVDVDRLYNLDMGAEGIGFDLLRKLASGDAAPRGRAVDLTLKNYIKDCVLGNSSGQGRCTDLQTLYTSSDLALELENCSQNPTLRTEVYSDSGQVTLESCSAAFGVIRPHFIDSLTEYREQLQRYCASVDMGSGDQIGACSDIITSTILRSVGTHYSDATEAIRNTNLANAMWDALGDMGDFDTIYQREQNTKVMVGAVGAFASANDWFPIIRAALTATVICLTPFLLLFVPTPLFGKALGVFFGLFSFLAIWQLTDFLLFNMAMTYIEKMFQPIQDAGYGFANIMSMPDAMTRALGVFSLIRTSGMVLATLLTGVFVRVGAYELTQLSGTLGGSIRSSSESAAYSSVDPRGRAQNASSLEQAQIMSHIPENMTLTQSAGYREAMAMMERDQGATFVNSVGGVQNATGLLSNSGLFESELGRRLATAKGTSGAVQSTGRPADVMGVMGAMASPAQQRTQQEIVSAEALTAATHKAGTTVEEMQRKGGMQQAWDRVEGVQFKQEMGRKADPRGSELDQQGRRARYEAVGGLATGYYSRGMELVEAEEAGGERALDVAQRNAQMDVRGHEIGSLWTKAGKNQILAKGSISNEDRDLFQSYYKDPATHGFMASTGSFSINNADDKQLKNLISYVGNNGEGEFGEFREALGPGNEAKMNTLMNKLRGHRVDVSMAWDPQKKNYVPVGMTSSRVLSGHDKLGFDYDVALDGYQRRITTDQWGTVATHQDAGGYSPGNEFPFLVKLGDESMPLERELSEFDRMGQAHGDAAQAVMSTTYGRELGKFLHQVLGVSSSTSVSHEFDSGKIGLNDKLHGYGVRINATGGTSVSGNIDGFTEYSRERIREYRDDIAANGYSDERMAKLHRELYEPYKAIMDAKSSMGVRLAADGTAEDIAAKDMQTVFGKIKEHMVETYELAKIGASWRPFSNDGREDR